MSNKYYSYIYEGESEKHTINFIKTNFIEQNTIILCKQHCVKISGGIGNHIKKIEHCTQFLIIDKDDLDENKIKKIENDCKNQGINFIFSKPCLEVIFLSNYENVTSNMKNNEINEKLKKIFKNNKKFEKLPKPDRLEYILNQIAKNNQFESWKSNLRKCKKNGISNFIDLIDFFENKN